MNEQNEVGLGVILVRRNKGLEKGVAVGMKSREDWRESVRHRDRSRGEGGN